MGRGRERRLRHLGFIDCLYLQTIHMRIKREGCSLVICTTRLSCTGACRHYPHRLTDRCSLVAWVRAPLQKKADTRKERAEEEEEEGKVYSKLTQ